MDELVGSSNDSGSRADAPIRELGRAAERTLRIVRIVKQTVGSKRPMDVHWKETDLSYSRSLMFITLLLAGISSVDAEWPYDDAPRSRGLPLEIGVRVGHDYDSEAPSGGGQVRIPIPRFRGFMLVPSADIYDADDGVDWQANVDLLMSSGPRGGFYAGLGFGWAEEGRPERERAINQILGLRLPIGRGGLRAYVEGRWTELARDTVFRLVGGVNVPLFRY